MRLYKLFIKRLLDIFCSGLLIILLLPLFLFLIAFIGIKNKGRGVFFIQKRPGKNAEIFKVIKLKTMTDDIDKDGNLLPDDQRITKIGSFIRTTSLDEIPQLFNVLKGDMSFIGPRPLMPKYIPLYSKEQNRRHDVRPGITGWAQVNGRNNISWTKKFEYDIWYINNLSFPLDLRIIFMTIRRVVKKDGVAKDGFATTEAFNGSN